MAKCLFFVLSVANKIIKYKQIIRSPFMKAWEVVPEVEQLAVMLCVSVHHVPALVQDYK